MSTVVRRVTHYEVPMFLALGIAQFFAPSYAVGAVSISGIISENGIPTSGAEVFANETGSVKTDNAGVYSITAEAGSIHLTVRTARGEYIDDETLTLDDGQSVELNFEFIPWTLSGVVTENGGTLMGASVSAGANAPVFTDGEGRYRTKLAGTTATVVVNSAAGEWIDSREVSKPSGAAATANFNFQPATISGVVTENGEPIKGALIYLQLNKPVATDSEGHYSARTQAGFHPIIAFTSAGEYINDLMLSFDPATVTTQNFDFRPVVVSGKVQQGGAALSGVEVHVGANASVTTDDTGAYALRVQEGTWRAFAQDAAAVLGDTLVNTADQDSIVVNLQ